MCQRRILRCGALVETLAMREREFLDAPVRAGRPLAPGLILCLLWGAAVAAIETKQKPGVKAIRITEPSLACFTDAKL